MRIAWLFLLSIIIVNLALSESDTQTKFLFQADQIVQGTGFFSAYKDLSTKDMQMDSKGYGSGSYDTESMIKLQNDAEYNPSTGDYSLTNEQKIKHDEKVDFSYSPVDFNLSRSFMAVQLKKLGKEGTWVKNYADPISMNVLFDSASVLSKSLSVELYFIESNSDDDYEALNKEKGFTKLNVDAAFTGKGHVGVLEQHYSDVPNAKSQLMDYLIDEDYSGTFYMTRKISQEFNKTDASYVDHWLPCCSGGFEGMDPMDAKAFKSAQGIFNCTCFRAPSNAQIPRIY